MAPTVNLRCSIPATASCPTGSYEDASGDCRKPVANAKGAYSCADAASALNGKTCVCTTAFSVTITPDMYKCAEGARAVIGTDVICVLGAADCQHNERSELPARCAFD